MFCGRRFMLSNCNEMIRTCSAWTSADAKCVVLHPRWGRQDAHPLASMLTNSWRGMTRSVEGLLLGFVTKEDAREEGAEEGAVHSDLRSVRGSTLNTHCRRDP